MVVGDGGGVEFPVTSFMPAKRLVRRKGLVTNGALVRKRQLGRRRQGRRLQRGRRSCGGRNTGSAAAGEHDKAKSQVLFLGRRRRGWGFAAGALGALAFGPRIDGGVDDVHVFETERRGRCCGRGVQSFKSHI